MSKLLLQITDQDVEYVGEQQIIVERDIFRWIGGYSFDRLHCGFGVQPGRTASCLQHGKDPFIELIIDKEEDMQLLSTLQSHAIQLGSIHIVDKTSYFYKLREAGCKAKELAEEEGRGSPRVWYQLYVVLPDTTMFWTEKKRDGEEVLTRTTINAITPHSIISLRGSRICAEYMPITKSENKSYLCCLRLVPGNILVHEQQRYDPFNINDDDSLFE